MGRDRSGLSGEAPGTEPSAVVKMPYERPVLADLGDFITVTRDFGPFPPGDIPGFFTGEEPDHDPYS
ncbi:MAG TPA: hypothetical protein VNZ57_08255 [Longimicrobiales bacterium]|nr:hypothetical protein [Longimicrobiales bacterium]